jgi:hypothetical protein
VSETVLETGSFRDKTGRVFYREGRVFRALSTEALEHWNQLRAAPFFERFVKDGKIIRTEPSSIPPPPPRLASPPWAAVLEHESIPFISYPYEWTFGMLKDAALLQLELLEAALGAGMILKDATPYNIQWRGMRPVFIDIPSFVQWQPGTPWIAYGQFCQLFLYPLLLQGLRGVAFQPWLRGAIEGIPADQIKRLLSWSDIFKRGILSHVFLHAQLQARFNSPSGHVRDDLQKAAFSKDLILANIHGLQRLINGLTWNPPVAGWADYANQRNYSDTDYEAKRHFVREALQQKPRNLVWDLGCNRGDFSRLAGENVRQVMAMDADPGVVELVYQELKSTPASPITPLLTNFADSSPNLGWLGQERKALTERSKPDFILCLALIHHLAITANIPIEEWIGWLRRFGADLVIEFVTPADEMVQGLLRRKDSRHDDYRQDHFEHALGQVFQIQRRLSLNQDRRCLYFCQPK